MIKNILRLIMLACVLMCFDLVDARGRSSFGGSSFGGSSFGGSSTSRSYGGSSSTRTYRSSYVVRTPVNRYTRSDGYVVIIANGGYMGNERYYYDNVYGESVRNPAYRESNPLGGFLAFCCLVCCTIIGCCNAANN
jgi:hypothetical protein